MRRHIFFLFLMVVAVCLLSGCHHRYHRYHGPKPFMCKVLVTYDGKDYIGRDEGKTMKKALKEALEDACERACDGSECERKCADFAERKGYACRDRSSGDIFKEGEVNK